MHETDYPISISCQGFGIYERAPKGVQVQPTVRVRVKGRVQELDSLGSRITNDKCTEHDD